MLRIFFFLEIIRQQDYHASWASSDYVEDCSYAYSKSYN